MDQNRPQGLRRNRGERWQMDQMATGPEEGQGGKTAKEHKTDPKDQAH